MTCTYAQNIPQNAQLLESPSEGSNVALEQVALQEDALKGRRRLRAHTQAKMSLNHTQRETN